MFIRTERSVGEFIKFYPVVSIIVIINLVLWVLTGLFMTRLGADIYLFGIGQNFAVSNGQYWRLFTPIFLHAGFAHVAFNSFSLILFGPALERMLGKPVFIVAYILMGFIGNLGPFLVEPLSTGLHVGASTSIYGIIGVYIYMRTFRKDLIDSASAQLVTTIAIIGFIMTFIQPNIHVQGHVFGFIGGVIIAPLILIKAKRFYRPISTQPARKAQSDPDIGYNPDRWKKKGLLPPKVRKNLIWIIFGILVLAGIIAQYFGGF